MGSGIDWTVVGPMLGAIVAAAFAWASSRNSSRTDMEKDAYVRARKIDIDTIERLTEDNDQQRRRIEELENEVYNLHMKIHVLEQRIGDNK